MSSGSKKYLESCIVCSKTKLENDSELHKIEEGIATDGRENKAACVNFLGRVH